MNRHIGEYDAALYLAISDFEWKEGRIDLAKDALQRGLIKNARPEESLRKRLMELEENEVNMQSHNVTNDKLKKDNTSIDQLGASLHIPPLPSSTSVTKGNLSSNRIPQTTNMSSTNLAEEVEMQENTINDEELDDDEISFSPKKMTGSPNQHHKGSTDESIPPSRISRENTLDVPKENLNDSQMSESLEFDIRPKTTQVIDPMDQSLDISSRTEENDNRELSQIGADQDRKMASEEKEKTPENIIKIPPIKSLQKPDAGPTSPALQKSNYIRNRITELRAKNKSSMLTRSKRKGVLGGAQRIDPNTSISSIASDDSDLDE